MAFNNFVRGGTYPTKLDEYHCVYKKKFEIAQFFFKILWF